MKDTKTNITKNFNDLLREEKANEMKDTKTNITKNFNEILKTDYQRLQEMKSKVIKLEQEKDSLVKLANDRFDVIEKLKEENEKLEYLIKHLKTEMRVARSFLEYEKNENIR